MRSMLHVVAAIAALAVLFIAPAGAAGRIKIVAAENFYGALARQIGGDAVEVTSVLSNPDQDPHLFEAAPSTARAIANADIVIYNGAGYDGWIEHLLGVASRPDARLIVAAKLVGATDSDNPHLWYNPTTFPAVAEALAGKLSRIAPDRAAMFAANLRRFESEYETVRHMIRSIRSRHAGTIVTATEPVFNDMADALGFDVVNNDFQRAVMNGTEPGPRTVAAFETSLSEGSVQILFYNSQIADPSASRLVAEARQHGVKVVGVTETMPGRMTITEWLSTQLADVRKALWQAGG